MAIRPSLSPGAILVHAQSALGMTHAEFGAALGASQRTAARWAAGQATPGIHGWHALAKLLHPIDKKLAAEAAAAAGETLEWLGLEAPPLAAVSPAVASAPARPAATPSPEDLVDLVVCAASDHGDILPKTLRPLLYVAFKRAREVGLSLETVERALRPPGEKPAPEATGKKPRAGRAKQA